jgi:alkylated DNA repair protein (DNA oxidative demethylase)
VTLSFFENVVELPDGFSVLSIALGFDAQEQAYAAIGSVVASAPFSQPRTKGGGQFSAELTNCGAAGWWSDERGYRYETVDPRSGLPWPDMPSAFTEMLNSALTGTEAAGFEPDACLINHYAPGAKMGLHQDKDEADFSHPIVTVCLGASADFWIGGFKRADKPMIVPVHSGDVLIMGGASRMRYHGVRKVYAGTSPLAGLDGRISLTFRKAL